MENKGIERNKRMKNSIFILILVASLFFNLFQFLEYRASIRRQEIRTEGHLHQLSQTSGAVSERIDIFINSIINGSNDTNIARVHDNWKSVILGREALLFFQDNLVDNYIAPDEWPHINSVLRSVNSELNEFTFNFLEQGYSLKQEDIEKLKAVSEIYLIVSESIVIEPGNIYFEPDIVESLRVPLEMLE